MLLLMHDSGRDSPEDCTREEKMSTQTITNLPPASHTFPAETGQRLMLHGVSWETYERLLADFQDSHTAHFTYDRGQAFGRCDPIHDGRPLPQGIQ